MSIEAKKRVVAGLAFLFLASLVFVQWKEVTRRQAEVGLTRPHINVPQSSRDCVECHAQSSVGIVSHWEGSTHAERGVGCVECHTADKDDPDAFTHYGEVIATIVTPRDCSRCHKHEAEEFQNSHHAKG